MLRFLFLFLAVTLALCDRPAQAQTITDPIKNLVQINGVIMTSDSLRAVPYAIVQVKGKNRGVMSGEQGVFSIVVYKGDTLQFSSLGYRPTEYVLPSDISGSFFSLIQLMVQDTFYLPETIVRPLPNKENFMYAFRSWKIPNDQYEIARQNTDIMLLRAMAYTTPRSGGEMQSVYQMQQRNDAVFYGQNRPSNITNPLKWAEFFEAWKRGDYRKKR